MMIIAMKNESYRMNLVIVQFSSREVLDEAGQPQILCDFDIQNDRKIEYGRYDETVHDIDN